LTQRGATAQRQAHRARGLLVGAQVALSFVLLVGAGLLVRSLINRLGVSLGFPLQHLVTGELSLLRPNSSAAQRADRFDQIVERLAAVPGVAQASAASIVPMGGEGQNTGFQPLDRPPLPPMEQPPADVRFIHYNYIRTMGIPLIAGRLLGPEERAGTAIHVL